MSKQSDTTLVDGVLSVAAHLEPELDEALAEHRLTRPSFQVLSALLDAPDNSLTQRELMSTVRRTSGTVSVRLARLERAGLVTRAPHESDKRRVGLRLTDEGQRVLRRVRTRRTAWLATRLGQLSDEELAAVERAIEPLAQLLDEEKRA
jgi:DNA-binding MarR family transcriptional regulator